MRVPAVTRPMRTARSGDRARELRLVEAGERR